MFAKSLYAAMALAIVPVSAFAEGTPRVMSAATAEIGYAPCSIPATTVDQIQGELASVVNGRYGTNGGLFSPNRMWSAVVDRSGAVCSVIKTGDSWPGSRAIALAKAFTANAFSNSALSLSTTMLYASTQPGGSLWGLNESNPFNADFLANGSGYGRVAGGVITFGGGLALYANGKVIGGLGLSGDSSCADHVIAYRMRRAAGFDAIPKGILTSDNISYPSAGAPATGFEQPHCFPSDLAPGQI